MKDRTKQLIKLVISKTFKKDPRNRGSKNKASLDHYIDVIGYVLKTGIQWNRLEKPLHYTTYHKKFTKWNQNNVFQNTFYLLVRLLKFNGYVDESDLKNLFIDSTMIKNISGKNNYGINHYDRGKNGNKVTLIVNSKGIPLGMSFGKSNEHDINFVIRSIKDIKIKIIGSRMIADKGYVSKNLKKDLKEKYNMELIVPLKKNQKGNLSQTSKDLLNTRSISENAFAWIKLNRRIRVRYESNIGNYQQFCYLALIELINGKIDT